MQQFFEQEQIYSDISLRPTVEKLHTAIPNSKKKTNKMLLLKTFTVEAETRPGQRVFVSGNCSVLGNWEINDAFLLANTNLTHTKNK